MKLNFIQFESNMIFEDENGTTYRRYATGCWDELMGESWEPAYIMEKELEAAWRDAVTTAVCRNNG